MSSSSNKPTRDELLQQFLYAGQILSNETVFFHQAAAEQFGLTATDTKTNGLLGQLGPMSAGEIAQALGLTTGAITSVIDRLERAGFVRRVADPKDRRRVIVEQVPEKQAEASAVYGPMGQAMKQLGEKYSDKELSLILEFVRNAAEILRKEALKLRTKK